MLLPLTYDVVARKIADAPLPRVKSWLYHNSGYAAYVRDYPQHRVIFIIGCLDQNCEIIQASNCYHFMKRLPVQVHIWQALYLQSVRFHDVYN